MPVDCISFRNRCGLFCNVFLHFMGKRIVKNKHRRPIKIVPKKNWGLRSNNFQHLSINNPMAYFRSSSFVYKKSVFCKQTKVGFYTFLLISICLSKLLLLSMDIESNPGPQTIRFNLQTCKEEVYSSILKLEKLKLRRNFLMNCRQNKYIPKGLTLHFNLAWQTSNEPMVDELKNVLSSASSRILDILIEQCHSLEKEFSQDVESIKQKIKEKSGTQQMSNLVSFAKKEVQTFLQPIKLVHEKKLQQLRKAIPSHFSTTVGSLRLSSKQYLSEDFQYHSKTKNIRNHRKNRHKNNNLNRKKAEKINSNVTITEEDYSKFDPVVLAKNVTLSKEQIEICRLPDCFAPTPTEPIDVSDQLIGTYDWAERLRWHYFFANKNKTEQDVDVKEEIEFQKFPWSKRTTRKAPKGNAALEAFIEACSEQFLNVSKRRRIRDNLDKGKRKALKELKMLPITHNAACRYADKEGKTVITSLETDEKLINDELKNKNFYEILPLNPTQETVTEVKDWIKKWSSKGHLTDEMVEFITPSVTSAPGKIKPLIKTHKKEPYPYRFLLSGSGTPTQPLSKFVQQCLCHLTEFLPYQVLDTKEFLSKIEDINEHICPLPDTATFAVCDVISLFPNVDNEKGIQATIKMLKKYPGKMNIPNPCVLEALKIALKLNCSMHTNLNGETIFARPIHGTAMGPCHSCDFVDIYMGELDNLLTKNCPVPLLSSITPHNIHKDLSNLNWSRYRDDGITILPNLHDVDNFTSHLQNLSPQNIKWTVETGKEVKYLDLKLKITNTKIETDVNSKHCHSYLNKNSCHPPSVFKGLLIGVGTRLRMLCSEDETLAERVKEYAKYFCMAGWKYNFALKELQKGATQNRLDLIKRPRKQKPKKIAWVTTYDPRLPSKSKIIRDNLSILYSNEKNKDIFPTGIIISAEKKRKNLGQLFKPTIPTRKSKPIIQDLPGFYICKASKCDTCLHSSDLFEIKSPWDNRKWVIRKHLNCLSKFVIYLIRCTLHPNLWYVGSTKSLKLRWANHKSDCRLKKVNKCCVAKHVTEIQHPVSANFDYLKIHVIDSVSNESQLLQKELFWQANLGTIFNGLNSRTDLHTMMVKKNRIVY